MKAVMFNLKNALESVGKTDFTDWLEICIADGDKNLTREKLHKYKAENKQHSLQENNKRPSKDCNGCKTKTNSIYRIIKHEHIAQALDEVIASDPSKVSPEIIEKAQKLKEKYA